MNLHDEEEKERVLEALVKKRQKNEEDEPFFDSLDRVERDLLTQIHFGLYKVKEEYQELLAMK